MIDYRVKTDKDAYQYIVKSLIEQNTKSTDENGECRYRGGSNAIFQSLYTKAKEKCEKDYPLMADDRKYEVTQDNFRELCFDVPYDFKCAVGHIIDSTHYTEQIEGNSLDDDDVCKAIKDSNPNWEITENSIMLLKLMQLVHDWSEVEDWPIKFATLQNRFDENGSFITNFDAELDQIMSDFGARYNLLTQHYKKFQKGKNDDK